MLAPKPRLTREQTAALAGIKRAADSGFKVILLLGVTGSGKTEVYLRAIEDAVRRGKRAIYLAPEIALTPQIMDRVRARFGARCAVLHSRLSDGERHAAWLDIMAGAVDVVVGARSAVFAPVGGLGLVVVDEEHEASYKQQDAPRYNARETAIMRAKQAGAVVILGSATPSIETYHNALSGKYDLFELTERISGGRLPAVAVVDMRASGARLPLSEQAETCIAESLARSEQVVLFLNRRGFANYMQCPDCGLVPRCRNCNVTLTYHLQDRRAICHYCGYAEKGCEACPKCGGTRIQYVGSGTQKVEDHVLKTFPNAACARFDRDTTRLKGSTEALLSDFTTGLVRTLVGTQMLAKGHDFRGVGLVVVVNADVTMNLPDFRSGERSFQVLTQVAGRAGRGDVVGKVVIQTFNPDHHALKFAVEHDFKGFFGEEAALREALTYPPFARLVRVLFESKREYNARQAAREFRSTAIRLAKDLKGCTEVMGPSRAPISKVKNVYRWHLLIKGPRSAGLSSLVRSCLAALGQRGLDKNVRIGVDVDPQAMM
jgi:primosomal protein N' (replication factor Y)